MAAAVPVVGSKVGGIPEMVVHGETGLLVEPRHPERLADALQTLINAPDLRRRYGSAARSRAERAFSLELHASRLQAVYDDLLDARPGLSG